MKTFSSTPCPETPSSHLETKNDLMTPEIIAFSRGTPSLFLLWEEERSRGERSRGGRCLLGRERDRRGRDERAQDPSEPDHAKGRQGVVHERERWVRPGFHERKNQRQIAGRRLRVSVCSNLLFLAASHPSHLLTLLTRLVCGAERPAERIAES